MIRKKALGHKRDQNRVADIGIAYPDFLYGQIVGQMPRTDNLDAIVEDKQADRSADEVITMHQGVDQQFLEYRFGNLRYTRRIHPAPGLLLMQVAHDKSQRIFEDFLQRPGKVLGIEIVENMHLVAGIADCLDDKLRHDPFRLFGKHQYPCQVKVPILTGKVHILQELRQACRGFGILLFIDITQKVAKPQFVQLIDPCPGRQFVCMELVGELEQSA